MTTLPSRRGVAVMAAVFAIGLTAPIVAQNLDAGAISPGLAAPDTTIGGAGVALDSSVAAARAEMDILQRQLAGKSPISATVPDLSAYSDATLLEMKAKLAPDGDPCVASVQAALFLDAHLVDTGWWEKLKSIDRPAEATAKIVGIWIMPDAAGVTSSGLGLLAMRKSSVVFDAISKIDNAVQSHAVLMEHNIGSVEQREAIWTQEIVQKSVKYGWDEGVISDHRRYLQGKTQGYISDMAALDTKTEAKIDAVERNYASQISAIETWESDQLTALQIENGGNPILPETGEIHARLLKLGSESFARNQAARNKRHADLSELARDYDTGITALLQDIAKAETQGKAMVRYARPIALHACDTIKKDGDLPDAPLLPSALETPYERDDKDSARLAAIVSLPHDQLMTTLDTLGIWPEDAVLSCVCRAAGYGSSGTSQFYHPGTLGDYDKRYSCQQPGDPCIVAGFGCGRHPFPSNPEAWEGCAASAKDGTAQSLTDSILSRMAARRQSTKE